MRIPEKLGGLNACANGVHQALSFPLPLRAWVRGYRLTLSECPESVCTPALWAGYCVLLVNLRRQVQVIGGIVHEANIFEEVKGHSLDL